MVILGKRADRARDQTMVAFRNHLPSPHSPVSNTGECLPLTVRGLLRTVSPPHCSWYTTGSVSQTSCYCGSSSPPHSLVSNTGEYPLLYHSCAGCPASIITMSTMSTMSTAVCISIVLFRAIRGADIAAIAEIEWATTVSDIYLRCLLYCRSSFSSCPTRWCLHQGVSLVVVVAHRCLH